MMCWSSLCAVAFPVPASDLRINCIYHTHAFIYLFTLNYLILLQILTVKKNCLKRS